MPPAVAVEADPPAPKHPELRYQLELFARCGFAFAQPILDLFEAGHNDVRLFVVEGTAADPVLRPLSVDGTNP